MGGFKPTLRLCLKQGFRIVDNSGKEWANERKDHHRNRAGRLYLGRLCVPATQKPQEVGNRQRGGGNFAPIFILGGKHESDNDS